MPGKAAIKSNSGTPTASKKPTGQTAGRRTEIVEVSRQLFETKGFYNTSFDDIAAEIGIKREGLYYYFKNVTEILFDIAHPRMVRLIDRTSLIVKSDLHLKSKFYLAIQTHLELFDRTSLDAITLGANSSEGDKIAPVHEAMLPLYKKYEAMWIKLIIQGQKQQVFNPDIDAKLICYAILGMCNWMVRWYNPDKQNKTSLNEIAESFSALVGNGLFIRDHGAELLDADHLSEIKSFKTRNGEP